METFVVEALVVAPVVEALVVVGNIVVELTAVDGGVAVYYVTGGGDALPSECRRIHRVL